MKGLGQLELINGKGMKTAEVLVIMREIKNLTHLNLTLDGLSSADMAEIVRNAPKLREFKYCRWAENMTFDYNVYEETRKVVSAREVKCRLDLILPMRIVCVPKELQKINEHLLMSSPTTYE